MPTTATRSAIHPDAVLAICCCSLLLVGMDVTIVNVALPSIQHDLHAQLSGLQWIFDAYTLVVASFLMFSGTMSDRFGRRRDRRHRYTLIPLFRDQLLRYLQKLRPTPRRPLLLRFPAFQWLDTSACRS